MKRARHRPKRFAPDHGPGTFAPRTVVSTGPRNRYYRWRRRARFGMGNKIDFFFHRRRPPPRLRTPRRETMINLPSPPPPTALGPRRESVSRHITVAGFRSQTPSRPYVHVYYTARFLCLFAPLTRVPRYEAFLTLSFSLSGLLFPPESVAKHSKSPTGIEVFCSAPHEGLLFRGLTAIFSRRRRITIIVVFVQNTITVYRRAERRTREENTRCKTIAV